jgi:hypothetical protein
LNAWINAIELRQHFCYVKGAHGSDAQVTGMKSSGVLEQVYGVVLKGENLLRNRVELLSKNR